MRPASARAGSRDVGSLALASLVVMAAVLLGATAVALGTESGRAAGARMVEACLLVSERLAARLGLSAAPSSLTALALGLLGGSFAWAVFRLAASLWSGWRLTRGLLPYEPRRFPVLDRALQLTPEIRPARVRLIQAAQPEAFTIGPLRPTLCVSSGLVEQMTEAELQAVLRHERAHAEARDPLRLAAVRLLSDFLWFLPVAPALSRLFAADAELRADATAVVAGSDPVELASAIVKTARGGSLTPRLAPALAGLALVERRVTRLLGDTTALPAPVPWRAVLLSAVTMGVLLCSLAGPALAQTLPGAGAARQVVACASEGGAWRGPMAECRVPPRTIA